MNCAQTDLHSLLLPYVCLLVMIVLIYIILEFHAIMLFMLMHSTSYHSILAGLKLLLRREKVALRRTNSKCSSIHLLMIVFDVFNTSSAQLNQVPVQVRVLTQKKVPKLCEPLKLMTGRRGKPRSSFQPKMSSNKLHDRAPVATMLNLVNKIIKSL